MTTLDPAQALELAQIAANGVIDETIVGFASPVQRFYEGAVVLVTGGSGFLGKQLIEKLCRSTKAKKIYILLREKKQKPVQSRLNEMLQDPLFEKLHKLQPEFTKRLVPVSGDISVKRLGITDYTWNQLTEEVTVIVHMAANINFVEPLTVATLTNVRGTREMLALAHQCTRIISFVHVSTSYCHATPERAGKFVKEEFYPVPVRPDLLIDMAEGLGTKLDAMESELLESWPNTYTFTKALAEDIIRTKAGDLPVCIVRPSIVMPACREPPGWTDKSTINGPVGFVLGAALGGVHVMYGRSDTEVDVVPVDIVNNAVLVAASETVARRERGYSDVRIYTVSRYRCPLTLGKLENILKEIRYEYPFPSTIWHQYVFLVSNPILFILLSWLTQFIPGYLADAILWLCGQKPRAVRLLDRVYKHSGVYAYFMSHFWKLQDNNLLALQKTLSPEDQIIYNSDITCIDLKRYMSICAVGVRKYLLKDGLQGTEKGRRKAFWLQIANAIFVIIYAYAIFNVFLMFYWLVRVSILNV